MWFDSGIRIGSSAGVGVKTVGAASKLFSEVVGLGVLSVAGVVGLINSWLIVGVWDGGRGVESGVSWGFPQEVNKMPQR